MTIKISAMTLATTPLGGTERVELVQGAASRSATVDNLLASAAKLASSQTFTGAQQTGVTTLVSATPITVNAAANNSFVVTLDAARQLGNPTSLAAGMSWTIRVIQDGTGSRALTFDTFYEFGTAGAPDTSADAAAGERLLSFYAITSTRVICVDSVGVY